MSLYSRLRSILEGYGLNPYSNDLNGLSDEVLNIPVHEEDTTHITYPVSPKDYTASIHTDTTRKLTNIKNKLCNNLLTKNINIDYNNDNIQSLIDKVEDIVKADTVELDVDVDTLNIEKGDTVNITISILDTDMDAVNGSSINVYYDNTLLTTITDTATYTIQYTFNQAGEHTIRAEYSTTNPVYTNNTFRLVLNINDIVQSVPVLTLSVNDDEFIIGDSIILTSSSTVNGFQVDYYDNNVYLGSSDANGTLTITATYGTHEYQIKYAGSKYIHNAESNTETVTVDKKDNPVTFTPTECNVGDDLTVNVTGQGTIQLYSGSNDTGNLIAIGTNSATYHIGTGCTSIPYTMDFYVKASGGEEYKTYAQYHPLPVKKVKTNPNITFNPPNSVLKNDTITLTASTNQNVTIKLVNSDTEETLASGTRTVSYTFTATNETYNIHAETVETEDYNKVTSNTSTIYVNKRSSILTDYNNTTTSTYYTWLILFQLTDANTGNPLTNQQVSISYQTDTGNVNPLIMMNTITRTVQLTEYTNLGSGIYGFQCTEGNGEQSSITITNITHTSNSLYNGNCSSGLINQTITINQLPTTTTTIYPDTVTETGNGTNWTTLSTRDYCISSNSNPKTLTFTFPSINTNATEYTNIQWSYYAIPIFTNTISYFYEYYYWTLDTKINKNNTEAHSTSTQMTQKSYPYGSSGIYGLGETISISEDNDYNITNLDEYSLIIKPSTNDSGTIKLRNMKMELTYKYIPTQDLS